MFYCRLSDFFYGIHVAVAVASGVGVPPLGVLKLTISQNFDCRSMNAVSELQENGSEGKELRVAGGGGEGSSLGSGRDGHCVICEENLRLVIDLQKFCQRIVSIITISGIGL